MFQQTDCNVSLVFYQTSLAPLFCSRLGVFVNNKGAFIFLLPLPPRFGKRPHFSIACARLSNLNAFSWYPIVPHSLSLSTSKIKKTSKYKHQQNPPIWPSLQSVLYLLVELRCFLIWTLRPTHNSLIFQLSQFPVDKTFSNSTNFFCSKHW